MIESHPEVERCYMKKIPESIGHWDNFENLMKIRKVTMYSFIKKFDFSFRYLSSLTFDNLINYLFLRMFKMRKSRLW